MPSCTWSSRRMRSYAGGSKHEGETDAPAAGNLVARDQHLLASPHEAGALLPRRHDAAERPDGDRLLPWHRHVHGRLSGGGGRDRRRSRRAGLRQRAAEWTGGQRRLRDVLPHDHRRGGKGGFDALWLDLHGAMVTDRFDDGEGELLRRIRAIDPTTPICVAYDMHANFFDAMVEQRADRHRLSDLSAHRPAADSGTRRASAAARDAGRGDGRPPPGAPRRCCRT